MKILIVGGTGFIGPFLVKELSQAGHELALFNRGNKNTNFSNSNICYISGDRQKLFDFRSEFAKFQPDVVIHMGAYTNQDAEMAIASLEGIANRMVVLSSIDVYRAYGIVLGLEGGAAVTPLSEESLLRQRLYPYGGEYEKIVVEEQIMKCPNIVGTILRLPMVYGPGDPSHRLYKYAKRIYDKRDCIIFDDLFANWRSSRGYVENVAHAIALAATNDRAAGEIYNVGESTTLSEYEWLNTIKTSLQWNGKIHTFQRSQLPAELIYPELNFQQNWDIDTTKIRVELGYEEIVTLEEGIMKTVTWELNNPPDELHPKDFPRLDYEVEDRFLREL
ncbi:nucleoside-diphosphate-sugar epimerase [Paenibacillus cellulosilyticus]|uniref:Nucleoside-diphosphate-sugar epimerase n=1 Tax=Paenibacillus cellulosilyticus TaxID=375489 RepID=A0A2V2YLD2_9BACL|nr:NAD-dependent epimerase/dehydratase family protein [Paenibacillus cellulosilyticus]PWV94439.1 nucleoside-diphosphate-sugar epimerase [Paenibacillus cellulosilyticus]QKS44961.1 NAD-dependent epimerase/dehydratase family protein [Paenibacillus cellulosilyticus]